MALFYDKASDFSQELFTSYYLFWRTDMSADYVVLAVIAVLSISGGLFLLHQAKMYRDRDQHQGDKHLPKMTH